jgi:hypothetical protein
LAASSSGEIDRDLLSQQYLTRHRSGSAALANPGTSIERRASGGVVGGASNASGAVGLKSWTNAHEA